MSRKKKMAEVIAKSDVWNLALHRSDIDYARRREESGKKYTRKNSKFVKGLRKILYKQHNLDTFIVPIPESNGKIAGNYMLCIYRGIGSNGGLAQFHVPTVEDRQTLLAR